MSSPITFDIETSPLPEWELQDAMPVFKAASNVKDPDKIEAQIKEKRDKWMSDAALHANRGRVLAIGIMEDGQFSVLSGITQREPDIIASFWDLITDHGAITQKVIGFNSNKFDIPFLIRRSWKLGIPVPSTIFRGRYLSDWFVDLYEIWQCGDRQASISLDALSKHFGGPGKNGDGAHFYEIWEEDRDKAIAYLENDVLITEQCAKAMGVIND